LLQRKRVRSYHGARKTKTLVTTAARAKVTRIRTKIKVAKAMTGVRKAETAATAVTADREVTKEATAVTEVTEAAMAATEVTREATEEAEVMTEAEVIVMTVVVIAAVKRRN